MSRERGPVVISGCSSGIGRATALRLARAGHRVFAGVRRQADADSLRAEGVAGLEPLVFDVTDGAALDAAVKAVESAVGRRGLQGVVANAGVAVPGPLEFLPLDAFREQLEVNVVGVLAMVQAFLPLVRRAKGRVLITGSIGGRSATPMLGAYAASKFALEGLAESLRRELAPSGIHVVLLEPGAIATPMMGEKRESSGEELLEHMAPEARALYEAQGRRILDRFAALSKGASPPERAAAAMERALVDPRPPARILVGPDAHVQAALVRWLPDRIRDAFFAKVIGLG